MAEYTTYFNGKWTHVYELDECIRAIQCRNKDNEDRIDYLEKENKRLRDNNYKDTELQVMQHELEKMRKEYWQGFPISDEEKNAIETWKKKHEEEVHGLISDELRLKAVGVSGGRYEYHFYPTAIGTSGVIKCSCGAKFEFQEIG